MDRHHKLNFRDCREVMTILSIHKIDVTKQQKVLRIYSYDLVTRVKMKSFSKIPVYLLFQHDSLLTLFLSGVTYQRL